jgi:hypothetical protein
MLFSKREKMLFGTLQRQNRVDAWTFKFAHLRTATQGSVSIFLFWLLTKKT